LRKETKNKFAVMQGSLHWLRSEKISTEKNGSVVAKSDRTDHVLAG